MSLYIIYMNPNIYNMIEDNEALATYRRRLRSTLAMPPNFQVCDNMHSVALNDIEGYDDDNQKNINAWHRMMCKRYKEGHYNAQYPMLVARPVPTQILGAYQVGPYDPHDPNVTNTTATLRIPMARAYALGTRNRYKRSKNKTNKNKNKKKLKKNKK